MRPVLWWIRRDLRLDDNPALRAALRRGPVIPVYVHAPDEEAPWVPGAASDAWLRRSLRSLERRLENRGSRLLLRRGPSGAALRALAAASGASTVVWNRCHEPTLSARDAVVEAELRAAGLDVSSFVAATWTDPQQLQTGSGGPYRVFTPYWRRLRPLLETLPRAESAPRRLPAVQSLPSLELDTLLPSPRPRWDRPFWRDWQPGEPGARAGLRDFLDDGIVGYREQRDRPDREGTSRLSPHLHFGEISPRRILETVRARRWPAAQQAEVEGFLRQLGWREFSVHLLHHFPHSSGRNFNPRFDAFAWAADDPVSLDAWRHGRTGVPLVDAGMRQLWQRGWMHNRVRMVVASFLTKNLRQHWSHGARWFWDTLLDADLANNSMGWQWTAGTGADAAPYFRVFNPVSQARNFDPHGHYVRRWVPELAPLPDAALFEPWKHPELLRRVAPAYPKEPIVDLKASREEALAAYGAMRSG